MWLRVDPVWTDILEGRIASETSVHTGSTRRHIQEDGILHLKMYLYLTESKLCLRNYDKPVYMIAVYCENLGSKCSVSEC
jgi:hypothetical protein